jgi:hypothetical protein
LNDDVARRHPHGAAARWSAARRIRSARNDDPLVGGIDEAELFFAQPIDSDLAPRRLGRKLV